MKLVLLRHATRSSHEIGDASLNVTGRQQAVELCTRLAPQGDLPVPTHLISSPKKRARQTLEPLADAVHEILKIDPRLDERSHAETVSEFEKRIRSVLLELEQTHAKSNQPDGRETCVYICSHMDWLETALLLMPTDLSPQEASESWATTEYCVFKYQNGLWIKKHRGFVAPKGR
jgi:broad specificity phosphatase PhoE